MRWLWDEAKNVANQRKHRLSFETAQLVFDDPVAASRLDEHPDGDRWQTVGQVGTVIMLVVHTCPEIETSEEETGRIISARRATAHERKAYEEGEF